MLGFSFGLGYFLTGVSWVYVSMTQFGGMAVPLAAFATLFFCSLPGAVSGRGGVDRTPHSRRARRALDAGIPGRVGADGVGARLGVHGFSLAGRGLLSEPGWSARRLRAAAGRLRRVTAGRPDRRPAGLVGAVAGARSCGAACSHPAPLASLVVLWLARPGTHPSRLDASPVGAPTTVSLLQGNIRQDIKWRPEAVQTTLETYLRLTRASASRLIVLPETAVPMLNVDVPLGFLELLAAHARSNGGDMLLGVPEYVEGNPGALLQQRDELRDAAPPRSIASTTWCPSATTCRSGPSSAG